MLLLPTDKLVVHHYHIITAFISGSIVHSITYTQDKHKIRKYTCIKTSKNGQKATEIN